MNYRNNQPGRPVRKAWIGLVVLLAVSLACINIPFEIGEQTPPPPEAPPAQPGVEETQQAIPTFTPQTNNDAALDEQDEPSATPAPALENDVIPETGMFNLAPLFEELNPGVVSIQVYTGRGLAPTGSGSGFILDPEGHIITNRHVVAQQAFTTVVFYNGLEMEAEIIGVDVDSDLAVLRVAELPESTKPLPLADSDNVIVGEWVIAIGNPFGLASSLTLGIVSAVGRDIPTGVTPFAIPQAIQTDAAINPGNSGGPLINLNGEVVGVNAQIAIQAGQPVNVGVGFAIPSNTVRRVAPVLIAQGTYRWPWLGVSGLGVNLAVQTANNLPTQSGTYIDEVVRGSPAEAAGLQGTRDAVSIRGFGNVPVGGDVIIQADGQAIHDMSDLLVAIAAHTPGEIMTIVVIRNGEELQIEVELAARPGEFQDLDQEQPRP
jgi:S1-C subfamily serine protease